MTETGYFRAIIDKKDEQIEQQQGIVIGLQKENAELRAKLRDTVEMYDFFYEGNGFKKRGLNNSIQVAEYIDKLEKDLSELTITDNYQRVISDKNEQISALEITITNLQNQIAKMHNFENCDYQKHIQDCPIFNSGCSMSCKECPHWRLQESNDEIHN